jgi:apolipoprotein N-acyltransferase
VVSASSQGAVVVVGLSLVLIIAGLLMAWLSPNMKGVLVTIVWWVGVILVIIGLILLLTPVLVWIEHQLRSMMGGAT